MSPRGRLSQIFSDTSFAVFTSAKAKNTLPPSPRNNSTATCCSRYRDRCTSSIREMGQRQNRFLLRGTSPAFTSISVPQCSGSSATKCTHNREISSRPQTARLAFTKVAPTLKRTFLLSSGDKSATSSAEVFFSTGSAVFVSTSSSSSSPGSSPWSWSPSFLRFTRSPSALLTSSAVSWSWCWYLFPPKASLPRASSLYSTNA
mmetsp:Transcript_13754/g.51453  ORF Transcript_13754/g.51453 Transcript_13754/m.51453 type:complete len:203 (-) Transcript_13754:2191-2799(-)